MIKKSRVWNISIFFLYSIFVVANILFVINVIYVNPTCELKTEINHDNMLDFFKGNLTLLKEISIVELKRREYQQVVIFMIDALRFDETMLIKKGAKKYHNQFTILEKIETQYPNNSWHFKNFADAPTYTALRLKSISMGIFPNFFEFQKNLNSENILGDSLFYFLRDKGKLIYHIGDTSLIKLHSKDVFSNISPYLSSGLHNTTTEDLEFLGKLINVALKNKSNEIIYFHLLGVDFLGHIYGIFNENYLQILKIYDKIVDNLLQEIDNDTLLVVMGDHGKTYSGDHGGSNNDETETFSFFFTKRILNKNRIFDQPLSQTIIKKIFNSSEYFSIAIELFSYESKHKFDYQINLCTTFAAIFNIPIPRCNEGILIPELIDYQNISMLSEYLYLLTIEYIKIFGQITSMIHDYPPDETITKLTEICKEGITENIINNFEEIVNSKNNIFILEKALANKFPYDKYDDNDLEQIFEFLCKNLDIQIHIRELVMEFQNVHRQQVLNSDIMGSPFLMIFIIILLLLLLIHYPESRISNINFSFYLPQKISIFFVYFDLLCCFFYPNSILQILLTPLIIISFYQLITKFQILILNFIRCIFSIKRIFVVTIVFLSLIWVLSSQIDGWSKNEGGVMHYFLCILSIILVLYSHRNLKSNIIYLGIILTCLLFISKIEEYKHYFKRKETFSFIPFLLFIAFPILLIKRTLYISISKTIKYFIEFKIFLMIHLMNEGFFLLIVLSEFDVVLGIFSSWIIVEIQFLLLFLSFLSFVVFIYVFRGNQNYFNNLVCEESTDKMKIKVSIIFNISFNFIYLLEPKSLPILIIFLTTFFISIKRLTKAASKASKILLGFILFCSMTSIFYALEHFKKYDNLQFEYVNIGFNYPYLITGFTLGFFNIFGPYVLSVYSYIFAHYNEVTKFDQKKESHNEQNCVPEVNETFLARSLRATQIFLFISFIGKALNLLINLHMPLVMEEYAPRVIFETLLLGVSVIMHFFITHWLFKPDLFTRNKFK